MAFSEQTAHYGLPHWLGDDKPTFLSDMNGAFEDIDAGMYEAKQAGEQGQADAQTVDGKVTALTARVETLESDDTSLTGRVGTLETTVSGQGGSINTINSLIGNGEPTTTDKTLIGAINEINGEINEKLLFGSVHKFSVTADGVKTRATLLSELHNQLTAYIATKSSAFRWNVAGANVQDEIRFYHPTTASIYDNTWAGGSVTMYGLKLTASHVYLGYLSLRATGTEILDAQDSFTTSDIGSIVPAADTELALNINEYTLV